MPEQDKTTTPNGVVSITDMDTLVRALLHWHGNKLKVIEHMKSIPEGTEVTVDDGEPMILQGDLLKGFQLGLAYAVSEFNPLPFTFELEDDEPAASGQSEAPAPAPSLN